MSESIQNKLEYIQNRENDSETLQRMLDDFKIGLDPMRHSMVTNIANFAYNMGIAEGRYVEKNLS